ncbi:hypothetical protein S7711_05757 [Stachybotrys chartarum IBT 7711]|uniref:Thioester reductase (TE) domain-containing protein n=1 Tax=Stachybotrys chartarum (strain CBS 109288 / IBT 7711) TaxID=1280523 RepID=A0A084ATD9_STACB|nr:hypothetical protein S7711_05757 [Stachybotrys chartarum IBT 7711]
MAIVKDSVLPQGSTVLVTGANGLVGANVVDGFLQHGFKVRGTVRNAEKSAWMVPFFEEKYGKGAFELAEVKDLLREDALSEAVKGLAAKAPRLLPGCTDMDTIGTSAVLSVASDVSFSSNPNEVITPAIQIAVSALKAAYSERSVKRFVQCSSSAAVVQGIKPGDTPVTTTNDTWNEAAVASAWQEPYRPEKGPDVYSASKTQQEQAIWKYHKEHKHERPDLVVNTVLPNMVFGKSLDKEKFGYPSTTGMLATLFTGEASPFFQMLRGQYYVNVGDVARLFVAGATFPDVQDERIFAFGGVWSVNKTLEVLRRNFPGKQFADDYAKDEVWHNIPQRERAEELLKRLGQPGWRSLEQTVLDNSPL